MITNEIRVCATCTIVRRPDRLGGPENVSRETQKGTRFTVGTLTGKERGYQAAYAGSAAFTGLDHRRR